MNKKNEDIKFLGPFNEIIKKKCPNCGRISYSERFYREWACPDCEKDLLKLANVYYSVGDGYAEVKNVIGVTK